MKTRCKQCKKTFVMVRKTHKYCSQQCWWDSNKGKVRTNYHGYKLVHLPEHPLANHRGDVYQHRLVMMEKMGRLLEAHEIVHHRNGIKGDNRIENLEIILQYPKNGFHKGEIRCPHCAKTFSIQ